MSLSRSARKELAERPKVTRQQVIEALVRNLQYIGENSLREGLLATPSRVADSWSEIYSGYRRDPKIHLRTHFKEGACKELVILTGIEFYSTCEHHMLPFFGQASIGYLPNGKIVGLSKLARCLDGYARRLQVQERLTAQVADAIVEVLEPRGVAVVLKARHFCMMARGVGKQDSEMVTSALRGEFENDAALRSEFMGLCKI